MVFFFFCSEHLRLLKNLSTYFLALSEKKLENYTFRGVQEPTGTVPKDVNYETFRGK